MDIISRAAWRADGATYRDGTVAPTQRTGVILHHSVTAEGGSQAAVESTLRMIERLDRDTNHWFGTYNFAVDYAGRVYEMSGTQGIGTHAAGHNTAYWGICYIGDGRTSYPEAARRATERLIEELATAANHSLAIRLHRDVNRTECPGDLIAQAFAARASSAQPTSRGQLALDGRLGKATISALQRKLSELGLYAGAADGEIDAHYSPTVAALQTFLNAAGARLQVDGEGFRQDGTATLTNAALQRHLRTYADGVFDTPVSAGIRALQARLNAGDL